jgi:autotransporter-associated beta strand protein
MKPRFLKSSNILLASTAAAASLHYAHAGDGSWNTNNSGNWSVAANWNPAAVPGTAAGDVVNLTFNISASRTITIDSTDVRLGDLNMADPGSSFFSYTLNASAGRSLILDGAGTADATVDFRSGGNFNQSNNIDAPIILEDHALFRSNTQMVARLRGVVSGTGKSVTFNNDTDGVVSDSSSGNGRFEVSGANTYTGTTAIDDVRVIVLNNTAFGAPGNTLSIQPGGQIYFNSATVGNFNYAIELDGDGWLEGTSYLGALRVEAGANVTGNIVLKGNASVGNNNSSTAGIISGAISGDHSLAKVGARSVILSGNNTYTGTTTIQAGTLQVGDGGTSGNLGAAAVTNHGTLAFNRGDAIAVANDIIGSGSLGNLGSNTLTLTGNNTYTGTTTIAAGATVRAGNGGTTGSIGAGAVSNAGVLEFNRSDLYVLPSVVSGTGSLKQSGPGELRLTAANTYTGQTLVEGGTLTVNGSLVVGSAVDVATGATLSGSGTIAGIVTANNGATIHAGFFGDGPLTIADLVLGAAPGDKATINVTRNASPGILNVEYDLATSGDPGSVTINVLGAAPPIGQSVLVDYGALTGTGFPAFTLGTLPNRVTGTLVHNLANSSIDLNVTAVAFPIWSGKAGSEWSTNIIGNPKNWVLSTNGSTGTDYLAGDSVVFNDSATGTTVNINVADVSPSSIVFNNLTKDYVVGGSKGIAGATGLSKQGAGSLTLSNTNSYSGPTSILGGTVSASTLTDTGVPGPLGAGSSIVFGGGTLAYTGTSAAFNRGATLAVDGGTIKVSDPAATLKATGLFEGPGTLTKQGPGGLELTAPNTHTGGVVVAEGTLAAPVATTLNPLGSDSALIQPGATLQLNNTNTLGTITVPTFFTGQGLLRMVFNADPQARNTLLANIGAFAGTLQLSSPGITGDKWQCNAITAPDLSVIVDNGNQIYVVGVNTLANVTISGSGNNEQFGALRLQGTLTTATSLAADATIGTSGGTLNGEISASTPGAKLLTFGTVFATQGGLINGNISDGAGVVSINSERGVVTLAGNNTYTGRTTIGGVTGAGQLNASSLNSVNGGSPLLAASSLGAPTTPASGTIALGKGANQGILQYTGDGETTDRVIDLAGTTGGARINQAGNGLLKFTNPLTATGEGAKTLTLGGTTTGTGELSGAVVDHNTANPTSILKTGSGAWVLSGANTFTGNTTIEEGSLSLAGSGGMIFAIGANGISNKITGAGTVVIDGTFTLVLDNAVVSNGNSWTLVDAATKSFGTGFSIAGFTASGDTWTRTEGTNVWTFSEGTGVLSVTSAGGGYADWAAVHANGQSADLDFDNDGVANGVEYFMGQTGAGFTALPGVVHSGGVMTVTWVKDPAAVATYVVETSTTLGTWSAATSGVVDNGTSVVYTIPAGDPGRFCRLRVSVP